MMDSHGLISYWNPASESIFGYRSEEAIGKNLHQLLVPEPFLSTHLAAFPAFQRTGCGNAVGKTVEMAACHNRTLQRGGNPLSDPARNHIITVPRKTELQHG